jgi:hypothetical protein
LQRTIPSIKLRSKNIAEVIAHGQAHLQLAKGKRTRQKIAKELAHFQPTNKRQKTRKQIQSPDTQQWLGTIAG